MQENEEIDLEALTAAAPTAKTTAASERIITKMTSSTVRDTPYTRRSSLRGLFSNPMTSSPHGPLQRGRRASIDGSYLFYNDATASFFPSCLVLDVVSLVSFHFFRFCRSFFLLIYLKVRVH